MAAFLPKGKIGSQNQLWYEQAKWMLTKIKLKIQQFFLQTEAGQMADQQRNPPQSKAQAKAVGSKSWETVKFCQTMPWIETATWELKQSEIYVKSEYRCNLKVNEPSDISFQCNQCRRALFLELAISVREPRLKNMRATPDASRRPPRLGLLV